MNTRTHLAAGTYPVRLAPLARGFAIQPRLLMLEETPLVVESVRGLFDRANDPTDIVGFPTVEGLNRVDIGLADLVLISFGMTGMSDISDLIAFRNRHPRARFAVTAAHADHSVAFATMGLGGVGFVSKSLEPIVIYHALRMMIEGARFVPEFLANVGLRDDLFADQAASRNGLTKRQVEVLHLLGLGMPNKLIAKELGICEATVKLHLQRVYRSLGVRNRIGALRRLMQDTHQRRPPAIASAHHAQL